MTLIGKPSNGQRTKYCFVYCGPERCDCGATNIVWKHPPHEFSVTRDVEEKKDPFEDAMDVVKEKKDESRNT